MNIDERSARIASILLTNYCEDKIYIPGQGWFGSKEVQEYLEKGDDEEE